MDVSRSHVSDLSQTDLLFLGAGAIGYTVKNGFRELVPWTTKEFVPESKGIVVEEKLNVP
jgi:hypothetical protein